MPQHDPNSPLALIADDDELMRSLMAASLNEKGFETVEVGNGREAVSTLPRLRPDLVILDVDMPVMNGFIACQQMRSMPAGATIPIVIITGNEDTASIEHAFEIGATDFISKPINWALLGHRMRYVLRGADTRAALAESEAENRALLEALPDRLALVAENGEILKLIENRHGESVATEPLSGQALDSLLPPEVSELGRDTMLRSLSLGEEQSFEFQTRGQTGENRFFEARVLPQSDGVALIIIREVTDRKQAEAQIHQLAFYDTLTSLPNRHHFLDRAGTLITRAEQEEATYGLFFLDFDRFKRINDTLGHSAGDTALVQIGERLKEVRTRLLKQGSLTEVARLGGDEFVVFTRLSGDSDLEQIAVQVNTLLTTPLSCDRHQIVLTPSIGIATYPQDGQDIESLLQHATRAMSAAKSTGGNTHHVYSAVEVESANDLLTLEIDLRHALEQGDLTLYYQPKYNLNSGQLVGAEALLRWFHPTRGMISPAIFIPAAEQSGLIVDIDRWVADRVCQCLQHWQSAGFDCVPISINLSGREFCFDQPAVTMQQALSRNSIKPELLEIEITETVLMTDADAATQTLRELKAMGIRLAVDDFGTGYSSMSYLKRFPLDVMKIDRAFVADLEDDEADRALCRAMISMARGLDMDVVAEGIETEFQLEFLKESGCEIGQGFLLDRPLNTGDFIDRLKAHAARLPAPGNAGIARSAGSPPAH